MADVKIHETGAAAEAAPEAVQVAASPSADLIRQALKEEVITDEKGRKILMRKPGVLAQFRIIEAVGPDTAANQTYMQMVNPLIWVGAIDGEPVHLPANKREVEVLIQRLDEEGLGAVMGWYMANVLGPTLEQISLAEKAAALKN